MRSLPARRHSRASILWIAVILATAVPREGFAQENRTITGHWNNLTQPAWGSAGSPLDYRLGQAYADGISEPAGSGRPNPRQVSNQVFAQGGWASSTRGLSDFAWGFGQFIDHDISLSEDDAGEYLPIAVPACDPWFDPACEGNRQIVMHRSKADPASGTGPDNPRRAVNEVTAFLDGSAIYGSDEGTAAWLRTHQRGKLKVSEGNLLPFNTVTGEYDAPTDPEAPFMSLHGIPPEKYFVAGDSRANEQPGLAAFHTLFVREHNRLCDQLALEHPDWTDQQLYQRARKLNGALIQAIVYGEFLPALGIGLPAYTGYDNTANPAIMNAFSAAAFRLGHTFVNDQIVRMTDDGEELEFGSLHIRNAYFNTSVLTDEGGVDPLFIGMAVQMQQQFDRQVADALRNFLFGPPGSGGLDLVSINIMRGRERGLPDYNSLREAMGLPRQGEWADITQDPELQGILAELYGSTDDIDAWVGMLCEPAMPGKAVGELVHAVISEQFRLLRDGDRYYYENDPALSAGEVAWIKATRLADILKRNTGIRHIQDDVFFAHHHVVTQVDITPFNDVQAIDIQAWPNPVFQTLNISVESQSAQTLHLTLYDISGRRLLERELPVSAGGNDFRFQLDNGLSRGVYTLLLEGPEGRGSLRLVRQ